MQENQINLMSMTAKGISLCLNQDFNRIETPERMAWIVLLLKRVDDTEEFFPFGKRATIQNIEAQLEKAANHTIHAIRSGRYHEHPAVSEDKSAKEILKGYSDYLRAHRG